MSRNIDRFIYILYSLLSNLTQQYLRITFREKMSSKYQQEEEFRLHEPNIKAKYSKTSMKKKQQLIDYVMNQNYSIYKASKKLKLSNSTAKSIINNYSKYGTILQKFTKNRILNLKSDDFKAPNSEQNKIMIKQQNLHDKIMIKEEFNESNNENLGLAQDYYPFYAFTYPFLFPSAQP